MRHANGYGSVIRMSGKRRRPFAVRITAGWTDDGKQKYKYISYHASKSEAMIALAEHNRTPYDLDANRITLAEVYERYCKENTFKPAMEKHNKTCFNHVSSLHNAVFKELRKSHFQGVINGLETPTAKSNVASFFRKLTAYAMENDIVHKSYADTLTVPSKNRKSDRVPFTRAEVDELWELDGLLAAEILLILCYSGMRIMELLLLQKSQINMQDNYIITGSKTEAGEDRYIPIHPRIKHIIEKHYQNSTKWLFVNSRGDKPIRYDSFHAKRWKKFKARHDLRDELTIHSTRHFFVSELQRLNVNKIALQKIIGHKGDDVTDAVYTHFEPEELHAVVNALK